MSTELSIRDARATDAAEVARLCTELGYPTTAAVVPGRLERLTGDVNARVTIALIGELVTGLATVHLRYTVNHETPIGQLTLLVVDEQHRGQGIGRALVADAEAWARARGVRRFVVTTALQRAGAHAFYERLGYVHTGRRYGKELA